MGHLPLVRHYRELLVYKKSRLLAQEIFEISKLFPGEEKFALTDQIRRSSRSIGAQIAESWGKRRYERYFVSKLSDADSEQYETQHWLDTAVDCGYLAREKADILNQSCEEIGLC